VFLQPDQYAYLSRGGTLWSWPGQNPFRWADPSGRIGFDGPSTDRAIGSPQDWGDASFVTGMEAGGAAAGVAAAGFFGAEALGLRVVGGSASNWIGLVRQGSGQLVHLGRHQLPMKDLVPIVGRQAAGKLRNVPLSHIGVGSRHFPLNPLVYLKRFGIGAMALIFPDTKGVEAEPCP
jgi:hypothetical protein